MREDIRVQTHANKILSAHSVKPSKWEDEERGKKEKYNSAGDINSMFMIEKKTKVQEFLGLFCYLQTERISHNRDFHFATRGAKVSGLL